MGVGVNQLVELLAGGTMAARIILTLVGTSDVAGISDSQR